MHSFDKIKDEKPAKEKRNNKIIAFFKAVFVNNWVYKLTSILLAFGFWFISVALL